MHRRIQVSECAPLKRHWKKKRFNKPDTGRFWNLHAFKLHSDQEGEKIFGMASLSA
jgi:hypothetical protein